jgi:hypothetical protein
MVEQLPLSTAGFRYPPSARHTCRHCETIVIDPAPVGLYLNSHSFHNSFEFSIEDAFRVDREGCPLFRGLISNTIRKFPQETIDDIIAYQPSDREIFKSYLRKKLLPSSPGSKKPLPNLSVDFIMEDTATGEPVSALQYSRRWIDPVPCIPINVLSEHPVGSYKIDCEKGISSGSPPGVR